MGLHEIADTIFDVLASQRSEAELQTELFDLLGFDRFELIQRILGNKDKLLKAKVAESTRYSIIISCKHKGVSSLEIKIILQCIRNKFLVCFRLIFDWNLEMSLNYAVSINRYASK